MIDDLTLLGESDCAVCHNDNIPFLSFL
jgi:hypothetical protein